MSATTALAMISARAYSLRAAVGSCGQDLRTAPQTVGYPVREKPHLGVSALLAGVAPKGIWQSDYLPECFQDVTIRLIAAHWALNPIVAPGSKLARFADGADD
jgi:hypothetical protein